MNDSKISVRYSKALFQSALGKKLLDNVSSDMMLISKVCKIPEFREFLECPIIGPGIKLKTFHGIFGNNVENITLSLIDLVVKNGRESYLPAIARVFMSDTMKYNGITECILSTAVKVSPDLKERVSSLISSISGTKVILEEKIDEKIIGGFILRIDDQYLDASITGKLRKIKKELTGRNLS